MAWWNRFFGGSSTGGGSVVVDPGQGAGPSPDLSEFTRATWSADSLGLGGLLTLGAVGVGCTPSTAPELVPLEVLDAIGYDPVVYTMESVVTGPAKDPEIYDVRCEDKRQRAEAKAILRPLLTSQRAPILSQILRAFAFGSIPIVLDYEASDLSWEQERDPAPTPAPPAGDKGHATPAPAAPATFRRTVKGHVHFVRSHEVWPGDAQLRVSGDRLLGVVVGDQEYGGEDLDDPGRARAFLSIWDPQFGRWGGQGSRRRVFKDWLEGGLARAWEMRALNRVVDPVRVGYAPEGDVTIGGTKVSAVKLLRGQMEKIANGSVVTLPGTLDSGGNPLWRFEAPFQPGNGHEIAKQAIDARDVRKAWACLSPGGPVDKATEEQFLDQVQSLADFAAQVLTRILNVNMRLRYGERAAYVQVFASDIPKRKLRVVLEVFRATHQAVHRLPDGRTYTLGQLVHPEILDQISIRKFEPEEVASAAPPPVAPGQPGQPLDLSSGRQDRRDDSKTVEGESDTGGDDVERDEQVVSE